MLIKWGLEEIPPILYSGFSYFFGSLFLLTIVLISKEKRDSVKLLNRKKFFLILVYGFLFITLTQGSMFLSLSYIQAINVSLLLNLTIVIVLVLSYFLLNEKITIVELGLVLIAIVGVFLYFDDKLHFHNEFFGLLIALMALIGNAFSTVLGRYINRSKSVEVISLTAISMLFGSIFLIFFGFITEQLPPITPLMLLYVGWLSIVNTALAFTIWNKTMQTLRAVDSSLINNLMFPQIIILSYIFLSERPNLVDWFGIVLVMISILLIQLYQMTKAIKTKNADSQKNTIKSLAVTQVD